MSCQLTVAEKSAAAASCTCIQLTSFKSQNHKCTWRSIRVTTLCAVRYMCAMDVRVTIKQSDMQRVWMQAKYGVMAVERDEIHMQGETESQCMRPTVQRHLRRQSSYQGRARARPQSIARSCSQWSVPPFPTLALPLPIRFMCLAPMLRSIQRSRCEVYRGCLPYADGLVV